MCIFFVVCLYIWVPCHRHNKRIPRRISAHIWFWRHNKARKDKRNSQDTIPLLFPISQSPFHDSARTDSEVYHFFFFFFFFFFCFKEQQKKKKDCERKREKKRTNISAKRNIKHKIINLFYFDCTLKRPLSKEKRSFSRPFSRFRGNQERCFLPSRQSTEWPWRCNFPWLRAGQIEKECTHIAPCSEQNLRRWGKRTCNKISDQNCAAKKKKRGDKKAHDF